MKIGIDIDEVKAELLIQLNIFYNTLHNTKFQFQDYKEYNLEKIWGCTKKYANKIVNAFYSHNYFKNIKPIKGSQSGVKTLAKNHKLISISYRPPSIKEVTTKFIDKYFPNCIDEIFCIGSENFSGQDDLTFSKVSKLDICQKEKIDLLIEDNLKTTIHCAENGLKCILFDKPWNQSESLNDNVTRVYSWEKIVEELN